MIYKKKMRLINAIIFINEIFIIYNILIYL